MHIRPHARTERSHVFGFRDHAIMLRLERLWFLPVKAVEIWIAPLFGLVSKMTNFSFRKFSFHSNDLVSKGSCLDLAKVGPDRSGPRSSSVWFGVLNWTAGHGPSCWTGPIKNASFGQIWLKIAFLSKILETVPMFWFLRTSLSTKHVWQREQSKADVTFSVLKQHDCRMKFR